MNRNLSDIILFFDRRMEVLLKGTFKRISWTHLLDEFGNVIPEGRFRENFLMMGPRLNSTGAPVHIGVMEDRLVALKMSKKIDTNLAYTNPPMRTEFLRARNVEDLVPGISTPHIALAAPYPRKTTKTTQVMLIMDYRTCSLTDFVNRLADHPSEEFRWSLLKKISGMGFEILAQLIGKANHVHRDIKPDNVLVTFTSESDFKLELTDFGISVDQGILQVFPCGTPYYSAREQQSPEKTDRRASWKWDLEGWVLSVVGMAADLKLIPEPGFRTPGLKIKNYHRLKKEFFDNTPEIGPLTRIVKETNKIVSENHREVYDDYKL